MAFDKDGRYFYSGPPRFAGQYGLMHGDANKYGAYSEMNNLYAENQKKMRADADATDNRQRQIEDRNFNDATRRFDLGREDENRQFDMKTNMFREMLARKMPDFFGAGSAPSVGGGYGQPDLIAFGGQQQRQDPGLDAATRNYLLRFLR